MEFSVLSNNLKMPMMGFGVFQVTDKDVCKQSVLNAIRTGYRLIDTAAVYGNEDAVGEAVWICPYISRHLLSLNPLQARCRRYSRGER